MSAGDPVAARIWETPRNIALLATAMAVIFGGIAGVISYQIGSQPPATINVHLDR